MTNIDTRTLSRSAVEALRFKVVRAVVTDGMSQKEAARIFGISTHSVCIWVRAYKVAGEAALKNKKTGRPKGTSLSPTQAAGVRKSIVGRCPDQLLLPGFLWTRDLVCSMIANRYGISLSRWTVGRYMKSWGLTAQKPAKRALEQNSAQVRYWLRTKYPAIRQQAKEKGALIWWGDESGLRSDHQAGTTWGEKGRTPVVKKSGKRFGCNMISAITNQGDMRFMVFEERFTGPVFLNFLERLVKSEKGRKVYLIVDRHSVHKSSKVEKWVQDNADKLSLFLLPPYSPELNPDELLNQDMKSNAHRQKRPQDKKQLMATTRGFLRNRQRRPEKVKNYFRAEYVAYAA